MEDNYVSIGRDGGTSSPTGNTDIIPEFAAHLVVWVLERAGVYIG